MNHRNLWWSKREEQFASFLVSERKEEDSETTRRGRTGRNNFLEDLEDVFSLDSDSEWVCRCGSREAGAKRGSGSAGNHHRVGCAGRHFREIWMANTFRRSRRESIRESRSGQKEMFG